MISNAIASFGLGAFSAFFILASIYIGWRTYNFRRSLLSTAAQASSLDKDVFMQLFNVGGPPIWLHDPSHDKCEFITSIIKKLWSKIDHAFTQFAFSNSSLENLFNSNTFWKPSWLAASGIKLHQFTLGNIPPTVSSIKVLQHNTQDNTLIIDVHFDWVSKMAVQLSMKTLSKQQTHPRPPEQHHQAMFLSNAFSSSLQSSPSLISGLLDSFLSIVFSTVTIKVLARELIARGRIRIVASPLVNSPPIVGALRISLLEPPSVSYRVSTFGTNPLMIPGLEAWMNSFISSQIFKPFLFPDGYVVNISKLLGYGEEQGVATVRPEGVLVVTVRGARNVPRMDWIGGCDPYIKMYFTKKFKQRTTVKSNTLCPEWNEEFQFLVHSKEHQSLHIEVWDSDVLTPDDQIGIADVPLEALDLKPGREKKVSVIVVHASKKFEKRREKKELDCASPKESKTLIVFDDNEEAESMHQHSMYQHSMHQDNQDGSAVQATHYNKQQQHKQQRTLASIIRHAASSISTKHPFKRSTKDCKIDFTFAYFPFSQHDMNAATGYCSPGSNTMAPIAPQSQDHAALHSTVMSPRVRRILAGGVLHVRLYCAENLPTKSVSFNKRFVVSIKVSRRSDAVPRYAKKAERGRGQGLDSRNPLFDQAIDFLIDGDTALAADSIITVEIWTQHLLRKATYKGTACVLLQKVIHAERLHDMYGLDTGGSVELGFEWQGMMTQITSM